MSVFKYFLYFPQKEKTEIYMKKVEKQHSNLKYRTTTPVVGYKSCNIFCYFLYNYQLIQVYSKVNFGRYHIFGETLWYRILGI